jgi:membrane-bound lytic murein transglycosylase C
MLVAVLCLSACTTQAPPAAKAPVKTIKVAPAPGAPAFHYKRAPNRSEAGKSRAEYLHLLGSLRKAVRAKWGKRESLLLPDRTHYVKYTDHYMNRVVVDHVAGTVLVERLDGKNAKQKLRDAAVVALLTPDDAGAVDLFSDREVSLGGTPFLQDLVVDQDNVVLKTREDIDRYTGYLVGNKLHRRAIRVKGKRRRVVYVRMHMVNAHVDRRALKYAEAVRKYAAQAEVDRTLVFAVIEVESAFNPYAVSGVPAWGMMQIQPADGGREAYRKARGDDVVPGRDYLFNAENNIELGADWLGILLHDSPLARIRDAVAREYCAIAAYNADPDSVFGVFSKADGAALQDDALDRINAMTPEKVYYTLRTGLPDKAARRYFTRIVAAKKHYTAL